MTFGELKVNDKFTVGDSPFVWTKSEPFKAYGTFIQNAAGYGGYWHYSFFQDTQLVNQVQQGKS